MIFDMGGWATGHEGADPWPADIRAVLHCPDCPLCGQPPRLVISMIQAACGTDGCPALLWNPSRTREQNIAGEHHVDLGGLDLTVPGTVVSATFARHAAGCDGTCGCPGGCA